MFKRMKYVLFFAAAVLSIAACSNNQPYVISLASDLPEVEVVTATPEPTKPPQPTAGASPDASAEPSPAVSDSAADPPRNETLYFGGRQWGAVRQWNPYSAGGNNGMAIADNASACETMFETLYMFNLLDGSLHPLLAVGVPEWDASRTQLTVRINPDAMWSDGTPVTADDVSYTYASHLKYGTGAGVIYQDYIEAVEAPDVYTVVLKAKLNEDGQAVNPLELEDYICRQYVIQKAWTQKLEARSLSSQAFVGDPGEDVVYSGPYHKYYCDDTKVVLARDDNYWGAKLWGRLPAPKYLEHVIYGDGNAATAAFSTGKVDVCQLYIPNVEDLWLKDGKPASTYISQAPYNICTTMPAAWFNMKSYGLDQVAVRKAIAMAVDYGAVSRDALTGQSPALPPSLMNATNHEQSLYNRNAVMSLQWGGGDIDGANSLLDEAGIVDADGDGYREYDGQVLKYTAACPDSMPDWQAAMRDVADVGQKIGIDIEFLSQPWDVYQSIVKYGDQTNYDIFIWSDGGGGPLYPWMRLRNRMDSEFLSQKNNRAGNWGGYKNDAADEIIQSILRETDAVKLKNLYNEAVKIYLTDVPSFTLMYKPRQYYTVNESVWTGFPKSGDGKNIPPTCCVDGYGIAGLYNLKLK